MKPTFKPQDRAAIAQAHVRLTALEAWVFTLGVAVAANVRADAVEPAANAQMLLDFAKQRPGFTDDGGPGTAILKQIDQLGKAIQEATQNSLIAQPRGDQIN